MPRTARKKSKSGIYHIILRGINKQTVFYDDEDREVFLNRLKTVKEEKSYTIYAFCLMGNHIHLLVKEEEFEIGRIMQKILTSYIFWYNRKYERIGNLFQDRFKSEVVEDDSYLLSAVRYIHQNPIKAGLCQTVDEYKWSSHSAYLNDIKSFVNKTFILGILGGIDVYKRFMIEAETKTFIDDTALPFVSDEKIISKLNYILQKHKITSLTNLEREPQNEVIAMLRGIPGSSIRQISRVTGIPISIVRYCR